MPLTYPVDTSKRYTRWDLTTNSIFKDSFGNLVTGVKWPNADGSEITGYNDIKWLLDVNDVTPVYDPSTEKLVRTYTVDIVEETYTKGWQVVTMSAEEQAAYGDDISRSNKKQNVGQSISVLRTWSATASGTTVTSGNAINVLQNVVDNLSIFYSNFADLIEGLRIDQ